MQASSSTRSVHLQVDTNYTSTLSPHVITGSNVWDESAIDYITRNDAILCEMKDGMKGLYSICGDIT